MEDALKISFKSLESRMKWDSRPKQKQNTTRYAILINKTNRHNSHVPGSMPTSDFDNILRILLSVGFCRKSESLVKFIDQYHDLFFSCTSQAQVEIAISRCFQDRILRRVTRTSGSCCPADKSVLFWLRHVKLYYHANQI